MGFDILKIDPQKSYDLIVSNPPYINKNDIESEINVKSKPRYNDVDEIFADINLIKTQYNWEPSTTIEDGLKLTFNKYKSN